MIRLPFTAAAIAVTAAMALPAHAVSPVEVTRFHTGAAAAGTIAVMPPEGVAADSLEFQTHARAVMAELLKAGFSAPTPSAAPDLIATLRLEQQPAPAKRSPFSIGIGGGSFGRNVGVGGGINLPVGGSGGGMATRLALQIRKADGTAVWEGRAEQNSGKATLAATVPVLARALLAGFPGPNGETVKVKAK